MEFESEIKLLNFLEYLKNRLKDKLPNHTAHLKMAPDFKGQPFRSFIPNNNSKESSVLIPICKTADNQLEILFTLRSSGLNSHKGQISFPGGRCEAGETHKQTALRETFEEIGISEDKIEIFGELSELFVPPSNTIIYPVIGYLSSDVKMLLNKDEVEEAFSIPLEFFLDKNNIMKEEWDFQGTLVNVPFWNIGRKVPLWGASAMLLMELLQLLNSEF